MNHVPCMLQAYAEDGRHMFVHSESIFHDTRYVYRAQYSMNGGLDGNGGVDY